MLDSQLIMFADDGRLGTEFWTFSLNTGKELAGDANRDGKVNFSDLLVLAENFGRTDAQWEEGDFDGNTTVDFADFLLLAAGFRS